MRDMVLNLDNRQEQVRELILSLYALEAYMEVERWAEARREYKKVLEILVPRCMDDMGTLRSQAEETSYLPRAYHIVADFRAGRKPEEILTDVMSMVAGLAPDPWYAGA